MTGSVMLPGASGRSAAGQNSPGESQGAAALRVASWQPRSVRAATTEPAWVKWSLTGAALAFLTFFLFVPLAIVFYEALRKGFGVYLAAVTDPDALSAIQLTLIAAGIALTALYAQNGWIGSLLPFKVSYTPIGVFVALTFIGLPFVVRTLQPVMEDLPKEIEEAAATLGASRWQTFTQVIFPIVAPALLTGFALAFARALGEYGSVIFIAGNMPMISEITPLLIITKLEQYDYAGATAIAVVMLVAAFVMLLAINALQAWARARQGR